MEAELSENLVGTTGVMGYNNMKNEFENIGMYLNRELRTCSIVMKGDLN